MKYTMSSVNESRTSPTNAPKTLDNRKQSILFNVATKFKTALKPTTTVRLQFQLHPTPAS